MFTSSIKAALLLFAGAIGISSCVTVKEYQKSRINDSEMALSNRKAEKEELNMFVIKEGAAGANSGKSGGGCGCN
jgi:hypothetical protein